MPHCLREGVGDACVPSPALVFVEEFRLLRDGVDTRPAANEADSAESAENGRPAGARSRRPVPRLRISRRPDLNYAKLICIEY